MSNPLLNRKRNIQVQQSADGRKIFSYVPEFLPLLRYFSIMDAKHDFGEGRSVLKPYVNKYLVASRGFNTKTIIERREKEKVKRKSLSMTARTLHAVFHQNNVFSRKDGSVPHYEVYVNDTSLGSLQYYNRRTYRLTKGMAESELNRIGNEIIRSYGSIISLEAANEDWKTENLLHFMRALFLSNKVERTLPLYAVYDASTMGKDKFYGAALKRDPSSPSPFKSYLSDVIDSASKSNEFMENEELMLNSNKETRIFSYRIPLISNADGSSFNIVYHRYPNKKNKNHGFEFHFQYVGGNGKVVDDEHMLNVVLIETTPGVADISNYVDKRVISKQNFLTRIRRVFTILKRLVLKIKKKNYNKFFKYYLSLFTAFVKRLEKEGHIPVATYDKDDYIVSSLLSYKTTGDQTRLFDNYAIENAVMGGNLGHIYTLSLDGYLRDLNYLGNMVSFVNDGRRTLKGVGASNKLEFFLPFKEGGQVEKKKLYDERERAKLENERNDFLTLWETYYQKVNALLAKMYAHYRGMEIRVSKKVVSKFIHLLKIFQRTKSRSLRVVLGNGSTFEMVNERHLYYMMLLDIYQIFSLLQALENKEHYRNVFENMNEYDVDYIKEIRVSMKNEMLAMEKYEGFMNKILGEKSFILTKDEIARYNPTLEDDISLLHRSKNMSDDYAKLELYKYVESMKGDFVSSLEGINEDIVTNETMVSILEDVMYKSMLVDQDSVVNMRKVLLHYYEIYLGENDVSAMSGGGRRAWNIEQHREYTEERMREYMRMMMEIRGELSDAIHSGELHLDGLDSMDRENLKMMFRKGGGVRVEEEDAQQGGVRRQGMVRQLRTGRDAFAKDRKEAFGRRQEKRRKERVMDRRMGRSVLVLDKETLLEHLGSLYGLFEYYLDRICNLVVYSIDGDVLHREYIIHSLGDAAFILDSFNLREEDVDVWLEKGEEMTMEKVDTQMSVSTHPRGSPYQYKMLEGVRMEREESGELPLNYTTLDGVQSPSDLFVQMMLSLEERMVPPMAGGGGGRGRGRRTRKKKKSKTRRKRRGRVVPMRNTRRRVNS